VRGRCEPCAALPAVSLRYRVDKGRTTASN